MGLNSDLSQHRATDTAKNNHELTGEIVELHGHLQDTLDTRVRSRIRASREGQS